MLIRDCRSCEMYGRSGCARCDGTGTEPITVKEREEMLFNAHAVLGERSPPDGATKH